MTANLERAIEIATAAHEGQKRISGGDYITHPLAVMAIVKALGYSEATQIVAVFHDTPEDTSVTLDDIRNEGFGDDVMLPLELLTKPHVTKDIHETDPVRLYMAYVHRLSVNARARAVKKADLFHNLSDLSNIENPSLKRISNIDKYGEALLYLSRFPQPRV